MIPATGAKALANSKSRIERILEGLDGDVRAAAEDGKLSLNFNTEDYDEQIRKELMQQLENLGYAVTSNSWSITLNWSMA